MKFTKSILTGTGAVVLAGLILALLAPKAAHAIAATAVQVENTTSSPVLIKDTERDARIPYESKNVQTCPSASFCQFYFSVVPAGYRLIVQSVVADLIVTGPTPPYGRMEGDD